MIHWAWLILAALAGIGIGVGATVFLFHVVDITNGILNSTEEFGAGR